MTTIVLNPDAHPETATVDGYVIEDAGPNVVWATIIAAAGNVVSAEASPLIVGAQSSLTTDLWSDLWRSITLFDASEAIGGTIDSVTYSVWVTSNLSFSPEDFLLVPVGHDGPATDTALVAADFDATNWDMTAYSTPISITGITTGQFTDFVLNAAGIAKVQADVDDDGIVNLGLVTEQDRTGSTPTWGDDDLEWINAHSAEAANPPKLTVDFTAAAGGGGGLGGSSIGGITIGNVLPVLRRTFLRSGGR